MSSDLLMEIFKKLIVILLLLGLAIFIELSVKADYNNYKHFQAYEKLCKDKPDFCYCQVGLIIQECQFKASSFYNCYNGNCSEGMSYETKELCSLAKSFNDKNTMFQAGCKWE